MKRKYLSLAIGCVLVAPASTAWSQEEAAAGREEVKATQLDAVVVTARKPRPVRRNWQAAHFEAVQSDYQLRVQLATSVSRQHIRAVLRDGVLRVQFRSDSSGAERNLSVA